MADPIPRVAPGPHPTPEQLYHARRGPRDPADPADPTIERVLAHAAACGRCSEELLRQEAFDTPEPLSQRAIEAAWARFGEPAAAAPRPFPRRPRLAPAFALAATLICAASLGIWVANRPGGEVDVVRGGEEGTGDWRPSGALAAPPAEFVFPGLDGEPRSVTVFDAAGSYSWTSEPAPGGRIAFPDTERRKLRPGVEYFWTVVGEDAPARTFRVEG
jgi:hypothetical protein